MENKFEITIGNNLKDNREILRHNINIDKRILRNSKFELIYSTIKELCIDENQSRYLTDYTIHFRKQLHDLINDNNFMLFLFVEKSHINVIVLKEDSFRIYENTFIGNKDNLVRLINNFRTNIRFNQKVYLIGFQREYHKIFDYNESDFFIQELGLTLESLKFINPINEYINQFNLDLNDY